MNNLNISIAGVSADHPYATEEGDLNFGDETIAVTGYGAVTPLGPDARSMYFGMLG